MPNQPEFGPMIIAIEGLTDEARQRRHAIEQHLWAAMWGLRFDPITGNIWNNVALAMDLMADSRTDECDLCNGTGKRLHHKDPYGD